MPRKTKRQKQIKSMTDARQAVSSPHIHQDEDDTQHEQECICESDSDCVILGLDGSSEGSSCSTDDIATMEYHLLWDDKAISHARAPYRGTSRFTKYRKEKNMSLAAAGGCCRLHDA